MQTSSIIRRGMRPMRLWIAAGVCALALAPATLAQQGVGARDVGRGNSNGDATSTAAAEEEQVRPPAPTPPKKPNRLIPYGVLFVAGAITVGVGLIPSKRTHQD